MIFSSSTVFQVRSHFPHSQARQKFSRPDALKDVQSLDQIDLDVWTALKIQGVIIDLKWFQTLDETAQQDWIQSVESRDISLFGLDREGTHQENYDFPIIQQGDRLLLTVLQETIPCLASKSDRVIFLGRHWSDRMMSWTVGCRFMAIEKPD